MQGDQSPEARSLQLKSIEEYIRTKTGEVPGALAQSRLEFEQQQQKRAAASAATVSSSNSRPLNSSIMGETQSRPVSEPQHAADYTAYSAGKAAGKVEYYATSARDGVAETADAATARAREAADNTKDSYYAGKRAVEDNASWAADAASRKAAAARDATVEVGREASDAAARTAEAARRNLAAARDTVAEDVNWAADAASRKAAAARDATADATRHVADGAKRNFSAGREAAHENLQWANHEARDAAAAAKDATVDASRRVGDVVQNAAEATADGVARAGRATKETVQAVPGAVAQGAGGLYGVGESIVGTVMAPVKGVAGWINDKAHNAVDAAAREKDRLAAEARLGRKDGYKEEANNVHIHRDLPAGDAHASLSFRRAGSAGSDGVTGKPGVGLRDPSQAAGEDDLAPLPVDERHWSKDHSSYDRWAGGRSSSSSSRRTSWDVSTYDRTHSGEHLVTAVPVVPYTSTQEILAARRAGYTNL